MSRVGAVLALLALSLPAAGCATVQQIAALRQVRFELDRIGDVRLAGVSTAGRSSYRDLGGAEIAAIAAAVARRSVPLELTVHLTAENPASNATTARLHRLEWTMFLDERRIVDGDLAEAHVFEPGRPVDVPLRVRFDALEMYDAGAAGLFELALALAGVPGARKEVRLDLLPTIDTAHGPIRYPRPIVVRRATGS